MSYVKGAVYTASNPGLPPVAVIFSPDGEVLTARKVPSVAAGEELIKQTLMAAAQDAGVNIQIEKI